MAQRKKEVNRAAIFFGEAQLINSINYNNLNFN